MALNLFRPLHALELVSVIDPTIGVYGGVCPPADVSLAHGV